MSKNLAQISAQLPDFTPNGAPFDARMHWVRVPFADIQALYQAGVLKVQRNHLRRLKHADHLKHGLALHANFLAVRLPDGSMLLADGYTRAAGVESQMLPTPEQAWLGVIDVDSPKEAEQIYLAIDSRKAVKTGRDALDEGLRKAGLLGKLTSPLFLGGATVTALHVASGEKDPLVAVPKFKKALQRLDALKLPSGRQGVPAGALGAFMLLAQNEDDMESVKKFVMAVAWPELDAEQEPHPPGATRLAAWLKERREGGALSGRNVPVIQAQVLGSYAWQKKGATGRISPLSREDYLASLEPTEKPTRTKAG